MDASILNTDFYQLSMMQGYFKNSMLKKHAVFDLFFRKAPFGGSYAVACGIQTAFEFLTRLKVTHEDVSFLETTGMDSGFISHLRTLINKPLADLVRMISVRDGDIVFPKEPIIQIIAPLWLAQILETPLLSIINHETLVATKAHRIYNAAKGVPVMEFGMRRAHGVDSSIYASRAAFIGGAASTSNVMACKRFGLPMSGTMSHAWVMAFPDELSSFRAYADQADDNLILLIDTYNTIENGLKNALIVFGEQLAKCKPLKTFGVRIDSGDLAELSIQCRKILNDNGFDKAKIVLSNDLDENIITSLWNQNAQVDVFGVGTKLVNCDGETSLGAVYKLASIDGFPTMKISSNLEKSTLPGCKDVWRIFNIEENRFIGNVIDLFENEEFSTRIGWDISPDKYTLSLSPYDKPIVLWPNETRFVPALSETIGPVGSRDSKKLRENQEKCFSPTIFRFSNPEPYKVFISEALGELIKRTLQHVLKF